MGRLKPLFSVILIYLVLHVEETQGDNSTGGYFSGGTLSFYFVNSSSDTNHNYTAHITVITGWVLGHGPCGPGCNMSDVGSSTHDRRIQAIKHSGKQDMFGSWNVEMEGHGTTSSLNLQEITDSVNQNIQGRIAAVSTSLQWEQEIAHVEIDVDPSFKYTDVVLQGSRWKHFDLNIRQTGNDFRLQTKIKPSIRNDTGMPNSSPLVLYQPIYRVLLNSVTEIRLTASDKDDDFIQCRKGVNVEIHGIGEMTNLTVSKKCVVTITAMESDGFRDDSWGVVALAVEDVNREPITMGSHEFRSYDASGLSSSLLDFMVWVVANMTVPEFVIPTPTSQHVFTVYAGSLLSIPLAAKPSNNSLPTTKVTTFHLVSLPDHNIMASTPQPDPHRRADRVVTSSIEWRTSDADTGDFIIQVVAFDSEGFDSQDRNYKIHVNSITLDHNQRTDDNPYFPFFPKPASISCLQGATCSFPIFARPGTPGHVITSIGVVAAKTDISNTDSGNVEFVRYQGLHVYRTDVHFTSDLVGKKNICFFAKDDHNLKTERCLEVSLYPPNPCDEKPCGNGVCIQDTINYGYTCTCPPGKTGPNCDQWLDPCSSHPCLNSGTCKSVRPRSIYACICPKGFSGVHDCATNIDECASNPCRNGGICVDEVNGYLCHCVSGYNGSNCEHEVAGNPCKSGANNCDPSSTCVISNGPSAVECKCPLGKEDDTCSSANPGKPLIPSMGTTTQPHSVLPTLQPGSQITCSLGSTCKVPVYLTPGSTGSPPQILPGLSSPQVTTSVTPPVTDHVTGLSGILMSHLSVTPQKAGNHSACVELADSNGQQTEVICYTINTPDPKTVATGTTPPPNKRFTDQTPPDGSVINCVTSQPCHIMPRTEMPNTGICEKVTPGTEGVYTFDTIPDLSSKSCGTDILLEPATTPTAQVCLVVGNQGEKRCYTVNTVNDTSSESDPCKPNPCAHGGLCMPDTGSAGYLCVCDVPYSGTDCKQVDDCSSDRCENQAVCVNNSGGNSGFHCVCQNGYGPLSSNCRHEPHDCSTKQCENGAFCVLQNSVAVCQCPLAKQATRCQDNNTQGIPAGQSGNPSKPHAIEPSPHHGSTLHCDVGSTCPVPLYMTGNPRKQPHVTTGPTSVGLTATVTQPGSAKLPPESWTSSLLLTPTSPGHHHVCVEIKENDNSNDPEMICYNIESKSPAQGASIATTPDPNSNHGTERFAGGTPPDGSEITCTDGKSCHFLAQTQKPPSGDCIKVRTQSVGTYTFPPVELSSTTCATDVLIDPTNMGGNDTCVQVGLTGEKRCYPVHTIDPNNDPCGTAPCHNNGMCIPDSSVVARYTCACPVPFAGPTCDTIDTCASERCLNQAVCTDTGSSGFNCTCQPGYGRDDCRHAPLVCSGVNCLHGAMCIEEKGHGVCKCPLGTEGKTCNGDNTDIPVNPSSDHTRPRMVLPSLGNGNVIHCGLHQTCEVPIYVVGSSPHVTNRLTSPELTADVKVPQPAVVPAGTMKSTLTVIPKQPGQHHVCVDVGDSNGRSDTVCYTVSVDPVGVSTTPPTVTAPSGKFAGGTPPYGSTIVCHDDTPCHILAVTERPTATGDNCASIKTQTVGVFSYQTTVVDSHTCVSDILIDPVTAGNNACIRAGVDGECRCFTVKTVSSTNDPCKNNADCQNGGQCIPDGASGHYCICPPSFSGPDCSKTVTTTTPFTTSTESTTVPVTSTTVDPCGTAPCHNNGVCVPDTSVGTQYTCTCPVPFAGPTCDTIDTCASDRCLNQAVCTDTGSSGFSCTCQSGYGGDDCGHAPPVCTGVNCLHGAMCVEEKGHGVCKCPFGIEGKTCSREITDVPVNPNSNHTRPHMVLPSLGNGSVIHCGLHQTCKVPIFVTGSNPHVTTQLTSPELTADVNVPQPAVVPAGTMKSTLTVTPKQPGQHHVCVDVGDSSGRSDTVCYIISVDPINASITPPTITTPNGKFAGGTPPNGSTIVCRDDTPCHVLAVTERPIATGDNCTAVKTQSVGVFSYQTAVIDSHTCVSDILIDPMKAGSKACMQVGVGGERRCFTVETVSSTYDPCKNNGDCHNGGQCIPDGASGHYCICPPSFSSPDCSKIPVTTTTPSTPSRKSTTDPVASTTVTTTTPSIASMESTTVPVTSTTVNTVATTAVQGPGTTTGLSSVSQGHLVTTAANMINQGQGGKATVTTAGTVHGGIIAGTTASQDQGSSIGATTANQAQGVSIGVTTASQSQVHSISATTAIQGQGSSIGATTVSQGQGGSNSAPTTSQGQGISIGTPTTSQGQGSTIGATTASQGQGSSISATTAASQGQGGSIVATTTSQGQGGSISATTASQGQGGSIGSTTASQGQGGSFGATTISHGQGGSIVASTTGLGQGGSVGATTASQAQGGSVSATAASHGQGGSIGATTTSQGQGGSIGATTDSQIQGGSIGATTTSQTQGGSIVATTASLGQGGSIGATTSQGQGGSIVATTASLGQGGSIGTPTTSQGQGSTIGATTASQGQGSSIGVTTSQGQGGSISATTTSQGQGGFISATTASQGQGGSISATTASQAQGGSVVATTTNQGQGVTVGATTASQAQGGSIVATTTSQGQGSSVGATTASQGQGSSVGATTASQGQGGSIGTPTTSQSQGSTIGATTASQGQGSSIGITTTSQGQGGSISATTTSQGQGGSISATTASQGQGGSISATTASQGQGGSISAITASQGQGGSIFATTASQAQGGSIVATTASLGQGGSIGAPTTNQGQGSTVGATTSSQSQGGSVGATTTSQSQGGSVGATTASQGQGGSSGATTASQGQGGSIGASTASQGQVVSSGATTDSQGQGGSIGATTASQGQGGSISATTAIQGVTGSTGTSLINQQQCVTRREAFKKAAEARRVHCTCFNAFTNKTYTVIRPRITNARLFRVAGIGSGSSVGLMALTALIYFLYRKAKGKASNTSLSESPPSRLRRRESEAWQDTESNVK